MDSFEESVLAILPSLREIDNGLLPRPTASRVALERLKEAVHSQSAIVTAGSTDQRDGASEFPHAAQVPIRGLPRQDARLQSESSQESHATTMIEGVARSGGGAFDSLSSLRAAALACTKCPHLAATRTQVVFGIGNPHAELMFIGEAPGAEEDAQGEPFVGRAGQLLTKIIEAMGFKRGDVYIANVLKCRPDVPPGSTGNRKPRPEEMRTCFPWLKEQIALIGPKVIVALGATAVEGLLGDSRPMRELRGRWLDYMGIPVIVTYHPAYLLRNQTISEKRKVWEDMLLVLERLNRPISEKQRRYFSSAQ